MNPGNVVVTVESLKELLGLRPEVCVVRRRLGDLDVLRQFMNSFDCAMGLHPQMGDGNPLHTMISANYHRRSAPASFTYIRLLPTGITVEGVRAGDGPFLKQVLSDVNYGLMLYAAWIDLVTRDHTLWDVAQGRIDDWREAGDPDVNADIGLGGNELVKFHITNVTAALASVR